MKKTIIRYAAAVVAAIAAIACSKDEANPGNPENPDTATPFTISASIDDGADTRISMDDDGVNKIALKWKTGDKIYVVNDENGGGGNLAGTLYKFTAQSVSADGKTAVFSAPTNYTGNPAYGVHIGTAILSMFEPKIVSYTNNYSKNPEIVPDIFRLYARYDGVSRKLIFKPISALLKLIVTLPQEAQGDLGTLNLASSDGTSIFYRSSYDVTQDPFARTGSKYFVSNFTYYLYGTGSLASGETAPLYIPVYPGTELIGKSIVITLSVGSSSYTATITGGNLVAGKCYPLTLPASKWTQVVQ